MYLPHFDDISDLLLDRRKKLFDVICCLYKFKQPHWLLCVSRNCDWSRKITPLSNLTQMASRGVKTYSASRIELRNLQRQLLLSEQPCEPNSLDVAFNIVGVERIRSENMRLRSTLEAIWFKFWLKWALATVEICVSSVVGESRISST